MYGNVLPAGVALDLENDHLPSFLEANVVHSASHHEVLLCSLQKQVQAGICIFFMANAVNPVVAFWGLNCLFRMSVLKVLSQMVGGSQGS